MEHWWVEVLKEVLLGVVKRIGRSQATNREFQRQQGLQKMISSRAPFV